MPLSISNFLSREVYGGSLRAADTCMSRRSCRFVFVDAAPASSKSLEKANGKGRGKGKRQIPLAHVVSDACLVLCDSLANKCPLSQVPEDADAEAAAVIAARYAAARLDFVVLVKTDFEREILAMALHRLRVDPARCETLADFHGRSADHVIASLGRTWGKRDAYETDERRAAVMFSRCRKSMIVCTSRAYLRQEAKGMLPARLAHEFGQHNSISMEQVRSGDWPLEVAE